MQTFKELKKNIFEDEEVRKYYEDLGPEYAVIAQVVEARLQKGMSQKELAQKMGTKQSAISRFESGNYNPTLAFLSRISKALDTRLCINIGN